MTGTDGESQGCEAREAGHGTDDQGGNWMRLAKASSALAHDLRAPLHALILEADLLEMEISRAEKPRKEDIRRIAAVIHRQAQSLADMLEEFLSLARPQARDLAVVDLNALLAEISADLELQWRSPPVSLEVAPSGSVPPVLADRARIRRALLNLCTNARDAVGESGHVRVTTAERQGRAVVIIADDGVGMTPDQLVALSEPFQTSKSGGVGLGFQIAREIVAAHGGTLEVRSAPGAGTEVTVELPAAR